MTIETTPLSAPQSTLHSLAPSEWIQRWSHLVTPPARVLDVACGSGRHVHWFASRGCRLTALDRDADALERLTPVAETVCADIEAGPWPLVARQFDAVVVTNYLHRPLLPLLTSDTLAPGGVLIYETFAAGNETVGKPSRPDFLLQPGELLAACAHLRVVAFEDGTRDAPERFVQRIVAVKPLPAQLSQGPARYPLQGCMAVAGS